MMLSSNLTSAICFILTAFVHGAYSSRYTDLEFLGVACSDHRDSCKGYRHNLTYVDRSCECDHACNSYNDCCIDAMIRRVSRSNPMTCLQYGRNDYTGVYVIGKCSDGWIGSVEIRQKCEGPTDYSDPLFAAPVTSIAQAVTYRNRYCAECNYANLRNLKIFQIRMGCDTLTDVLTEEQIFTDLIYDQTLGSWGVNRVNSFGNDTVFTGCEMIFDVPEYINSSVRFCRPNLIDNCPPEYPRAEVRKNCAEYMAVVYDNEFAYRNAHCAICNSRTVRQIFCSTHLLSRKKMSFVMLLDVNQGDDIQDETRRAQTPKCPGGHVYDPFFKKCREIVCGLPGYVLREEVCVRE